ncbi:MFS general substrate transporter [Dothidotthia symphoricarpi CBS 119687]|uniref:MFS general substrate transporter n=1 Tax=Dothidotthia symphoricarpi CBS 119687 TaxID=1392245 RepID=A0A6A5ZWI8_9PLEO|nr:MFS general substrate transporter [Dothidotthia symphoricarpi CBS 119687]KAF2124112.1 MFS general substrate transporter [Dothidotthia symphoricarpi CBS 119687]
MSSSGPNHPQSLVERTPLLPGPSPASPLPDAIKNEPISLKRWVLLWVCITIVAMDFGDALAYPPGIAIYESVICNELHNTDPSPPSNATTSPCKSPAVQGQLALFIGIKDTIHQLPGIVLALPYGLAADRIGRRPIVLLCLVGLLLEEVVNRLVCWWAPFVPLRAVWATPLFQVLGGGSQIATSMAYAMITDVFDPEERSSIFFVMAAVILLGEILATPVSAVLMWKYSPWVPSLLGLGIQFVGFCAACVLPETLSQQPKSLQDDQVSVETSQPPSTAHGKTDSWLEKLGNEWSRIKSRMPLNTNVVLIISSFFFASIGKQALQLVVQYASVRFNWSISSASFFVTLKGIVTLITLLIVLPRLSIILSHRMPAFKKDRYIVQGSAWSLTVGAAIMALATSPVVFGFGISFLACGWGFYSALRSLAMALVEPDHGGVMSTFIALVQSAGMMVSGPLLATAFALGLSFGGAWRGLPYVVAAGFFLVAGCLVCCVGRGGEGVGLEDVEEEER